MTNSFRYKPANFNFKFLMVTCSVALLSACEPDINSSGAGIDPADICAGKVVKGVEGTAVCGSEVPVDSNVVDTSTGDAAAAEILDGKKAYVDGVEVEGTAVDRGTINLNTSTIPSGGFFSSIILSLIPGDVCAGKSIFGSLGTAACGLASRGHRNIGSTTERAIPLVNKDHDGFSAGPSGNDPNDGNTITQADISGVATCGNTQTTVAARIADCNYTWDGAVQGNTGHGSFSLVTKANGYAVWRDDRTQMLWSDYLGGNNWCQASGNTENYVNVDEGWRSVDCTPGAESGFQPATPISMCAEDGSHDSSGYDDQKGGMRLAATGSSPSVAWRLPSRDDMLQAYANGAGYAMNVFRDGNYYWTSSVHSRYREFAWIFYVETDGAMGLRYGPGSGIRGSGYKSVRCVGR
jgi:hypothetical protein